MADLLTAALGGTVVFALTTAARAAGIPGDVRAHDAAIHERDEQLATWVADRNYSLGRECTALRTGVKPRAWNVSEPAGLAAGIIEARERGAHTADQDIADARSVAIHQYRDQERTAQIDIARIRADEGWAHRAYRKLPLLRRRPIPGLLTPDRAQPLIDSWAKQSSLSSDERPVWPDDARKRTLDDALAGVRALGP